MMRNSDYPKVDLAFLLVRFPEKADQIRKLASADEEFREICEHYSLARAALEMFLSRSTKRQKPEVADYKMLIADLEREIQDFIERGRSPPNNDNQPTLKEPPHA
jgi:hypothetical protein